MYPHMSATRGVSYSNYLTANDADGQLTGAYIAMGVTVDAPATGEVEYAMFCLGTISAGGTSNLRVNIQGVTASGAPDNLLNGQASDVVPSLTSGVKILQFSGTKPNVVKGTPMAVAFEDTLVTSNALNYYLCTASSYMIYRPNYPSLCAKTSSWSIVTAAAADTIVFALRIGGVWHKMGSFLPPIEYGFYPPPAGAELGYKITPTHDIALDGFRVLLDADPVGATITARLYSDNVADSVLAERIIDNDLDGNTAGGTMDIYFPDIQHLHADRNYYLAFSGVGGSGIGHITLPSKTIYGDMIKSYWGHNLETYTRTYTASPSFNAWSRLDSDAAPIMPRLALINAGQYQ